MSLRNQEIIDMYFMYVCANENALVAQRFYAKKFSNQRVPLLNCLKNLHQHLRESDLFGIRHRNLDRLRSTKIAF